jgi:hypothetical protein
MKNIVELTFFWLLPILGLIVIGNNWQVIQPYSIDYLIFKLTFPIVLMYLVVGTGAGYFQYWSFHTTYTIKNVLPQIGIIYSVVLNFANIFIFPYIDNPLIFLVLTSLCCGVLGTLYDIPIVHYGLLKVKSSRKRHFSNTIEKVLSYGPVFFSITGFVNGIGLLIGYNLVEKQHLHPLWVAILISIFFYLPFLLFFISQQRKVQTNQK